jgi:cellulose synthase/poly-beta-1,6-N-acetylglucosamine synthase-like glycosyltransferase
LTPVLPSWLAWPILALTAATLGLILPLALHRTHLLLLSRRGAAAEGREWEGELPRVTVQIPVYNECAVVERVIDAAARLEHPADRLEIQVLDDSDDETRRVAARTVSRWRARGIDVRHLRRGTRTGFKAGALQEGMARARGEFILILDADFVPDPDLLRRLLPPFRDPAVGMVQARWDHLNEDARLLTRCQALLLDAHFFFEQGGRHAGGRFMNFNGTAGMWRRRALEDAGGWSWDTLTEDLDVSYRAQMAGWRFVFLPGVGVPAEIPEQIRAFEVQQKRWAQGGIQTARKVLPALVRGPWPWAVKTEGVAHLLAHAAHPLTLLLGVLLLPSAVARTSLGLERFLFLDLAVFAGATLSFLVFYTAAGRVRKRPWGPLLPRAVATLTLGIGLTAPVSGAVLRGMARKVRDPFVRTPKRGGGPGRYRSPARRGDRILKGLLAGWALGCAALAVAWGYLASLPFLLLFGTGYTWLLAEDLLEGTATRPPTSPLERPRGARPGSVSTAAPVPTPPSLPSAPVPGGSS